MGTYTPNQRRRRTIVDTLKEAEEDHLLDCPNADFILRAASVLLDVIFCSLAFTALKHVFSTATGYLIAIGGSPDGVGTSLPSLLVGLSKYAQIGVQGAFLYLFSIWTLSRFGGSPGKLLLGMRVVDQSTGQPLSLSKAAIRETIGKPIGLMAGGFGFLISLVRDDQRTVHDLMVNSVVKKLHGAP